MKQVLIREDVDEGNWILADAEDGLPFHFHSWTSDYLRFETEADARAYFDRMNSGDYELVED